MNTSSKIMILGHTGMVGKALLDKLQQSKFTYIYYFNRKTLDLQNREQTLRMFKQTASGGIDYVFNCAGKVGGIQANIKDPFTFLFDNLQIQNNIIEASIMNDVKKVVNLGSSCIYPKDYEQPLKEEYLMKGPLEPTNEGYALAKICSLKLSEYANKKFNTKFISLMPSNLYGPGERFDLQNSHVLASLVMKICEAKNLNLDIVEIWGSGEARREFLYVRDLVDCMIWSIDNLKQTDTFLNVGTGVDYSINELAEKIKSIVGWEGKFVHNTNKPFIFSL